MIAPAPLNSSFTDAAPTGYSPLVDLLSRSLEQMRLAACADPGRAANEIGTAVNTWEAEQLGDEFEQLWLASPAGVFSLADAADDGLDSPEADLAHAACYSVRRSFRMNLRILLRCLPRFLALTGGHSPAAGLTSNINQTCQA